MSIGREDKINLFILNITVTLRCTLKCKLCVADVTKYKVPPHYSKEYIFDVIDKCFEIVDHVERFQLSGGEPLMHKDFFALLEKAMSYENRFDSLGIFTNGTILPGQDLIDLINKSGCKDKIKFYISHYGALSNQAKAVAELLAVSGIAYDVKIYYGKNQHFDGWIDYGNYQYQGYSDQEKRDVFCNCGAIKMGGIWSCRYGEIHRCTRSASGMDLGLVPRTESEYISLFEDVPVQVQREKLKSIMSLPYLATCSYCTGDFGTGDKTKRHPAAEQI
jgi:hypothetical protein